MLRLCRLRPLVGPFDRGKGLLPPMVKGKPAAIAPRSTGAIAAAAPTGVESMATN